jgi:V/A-type H+-transporting ATPase subunit I
MSLEMAYVEIVGLKPDLLVAVELLGQLGVIEIDRRGEGAGLALPPLAADPATLRTHEVTLLQLSQINGLIETLGVRNVVNLTQGEQHDPSPAEIETLTAQVQEITLRRSTLKSEFELLPRFESTIRKLLPLLPPGSRQPDSALLGLLASVAHAEHLESLREHIQQLTDRQSVLVSGRIDEKTYAMLLVTPAVHAETISALLTREDVARLRLPSQFESESLDTAIQSLRQRLGEIPQQIADLDREIDSIAARSGGVLVRVHDGLQDRLETFEVLSQLSQTEMAFVITGWVPTRAISAVEAALHEEIGLQVVVHAVPMTRDLQKHAPVALANLRAVRPFETLTNLYSPPAYRAIDPSGLMALFLPLFFGMMLGDIGYGILLLFLSLLVRRWLKPGSLRDIASVLAMGSVWGILFGLLFGEFFGTLGTTLGLHPLWFDRAEPEHLVDLLLLAIGTGAAHIALGLVIGLIESIREHDRHHLLERSGRLLGLISLFLLAGILAERLPDTLRTPAFAGLIVAMVLLAASIGRVGIVVAPLELIGLVGNVLSYLRIAAIGLASVYLAIVANEIAGKIGSLITGIIIAVLLHALNLMLGAFGPMIHSLRLHYVEFFRNFYIGGGRMFRPFRLHTSLQRSDHIE